MSAVPMIARRGYKPGRVGHAVREAMKRQQRRGVT